MSDTYIEFRNKENILPLELPNKSKFYTDIMNIEHSFSGRISVFRCLDEDCFVEHNDLLNEDDIISVKSVLEKYEEHKEQE